jgi:multiple sugar transport system permease protein
MLAEVAALAVGIAVLIWTLVPVYKLVIVALEPHGNVFTNDIWPAKPSLESFWVVVTQGHWYLEYFWELFGNSLYIGVATVVLTLLIGSLTSFSIGRMRIRHDWLVSNGALLTYLIPFYRIVGANNCHAAAAPSQVLQLRVNPCLAKRLFTP